MGRWRALADSVGALGELWEALYREKLPITRPSGRYVTIRAPAPKAMVDAKAVRGTGFVYKPSVQAVVPAESVVRNLETAGYIERLQDGWIFTPVGKQYIKLIFPVHAPFPVFYVRRNLPLDCCTIWDMILRLGDAHWAMIEDALSGSALRTIPPHHGPINVCCVFVVLRVKFVCSDSPSRRTRLSSKPVLGPTLLHQPKA